MPPVEFHPRTTDTKGAHRFCFFEHKPEAASHLRALAQAALAAWRLEAPAYQPEVTTGFATSGLAPLLNPRGMRRLPEVPADDAMVTRAPAVTDLTELLTLRLLRQEHPSLVLPRPRVFHKDRGGLQHHGIDLVGYFELDGGIVLVVVEVMASVERAHPPKTVQDHFHQLLPGTLGDDPTRLLDDLRWLHDECEDRNQQDVLNHLIVAVEDGSLNRPENTLIVPVLFRPPSLLKPADTGKFLSSSPHIEAAPIAGRIWFAGVELDRSFTALVQAVHQLAQGEAP